MSGFNLILPVFPCSEIRLQRLEIKLEIQWRAVLRSRTEKLKLTELLDWTTTGASGRINGIKRIRNQVIGCSTNISYLIAEFFFCFPNSDVDEDEDEDDDKTPLYFFLAAVGLEEFIEPFVKEKFDLDSLMLVSEADLVSMKIPLGHRRKLLKAISDRKAAIENPDEMEDSHL